MSMLLFKLGIGSSRRLMTETFYSSTNWVAPATTNRLETISGQGAPGAAASSYLVQVQACSIAYANANGDTVSGGNFRWESANSVANTALSTINGGGSGTIQLWIVAQYNNGYSAQQQNAGYSGAIPGSAYISTTGSWTSSGNIASNGDAFVNYSVAIPATTGASASGFGYTFPGGFGGPATVGGGSNVPLTPMTSNGITVPAGGSITISYYM